MHGDSKAIGVIAHSCTTRTAGALHSFAIHQHHLLGLSDNCETRSVTSYPLERLYHITMRSGACSLTCADSQMRAPKALAGIYATKRSIAMTLLINVISFSGSRCSVGACWVRIRVLGS